MRPVHPGEVLREDYLVPLEMSVNALALALAVPANCSRAHVKHAGDLLNGDLRVQAGQYFFGTSLGGLLQHGGQVLW
ncbi:MAG: hypothetical protein FWG56_02870 [Desulfovibrionaceae bacterium]|nr:hypothetical protein [Desulfovibrionaceae bacterium]